MVPAGNPHARRPEQLCIANEREQRSPSSVFERPDAPDKIDPNSELSKLAVDPL